MSNHFVLTYAYGMFQRRREEQATLGAHAQSSFAFPGQARAWGWCLALL